MGLCILILIKMTEKKKFFRNVFFISTAECKTYAGSDTVFNCVLCNNELKSKPLTYKKLRVSNPYLANIFIYTMLNDKTINILFDEDYNIHFVSYNHLKEIMPQIQNNFGVVFDKKD